MRPSPGATPWSSGCELSRRPSPCSTADMTHRGREIGKLPGVPRTTSVGTIIGAKEASEANRRAAFLRALKARSVAVVGASADPHKLGHQTLHCILEAGFDGHVYPINPRADEILGHRCYPSLEALPGEVDLVVVVVPAQAVREVVAQAGGKGAAAVVVLSGGFRESGEIELEAEIAQVARSSGVLLIGPNVQGMAYVPNRLCALMYPALTKAGPLAVVGQSGTVSSAVAEWAERDGLGVSAVVNLGNKADVDETDVLSWLSDEPETRAVALYVEGVRDGRRFVEAAGDLSLEKPVAVLKSGRTEAGRQAVASHTASLAGSDEVFSAACKQYGLYRASDLIELYDVAKAFALLRPPAGRRLLTISSSGGTGALAIDEASRLGLYPASLPDAYTEALKQLGLSPRASYANPLDIDSVETEEFAACARLAAEHDVADIVLFGFGDPVTGAASMAREVLTGSSLSVVATYLGGGATELGEVPRMAESGIPCYPTPERAIRAASAVVEHLEAKERRRSADARR
jgi:acyl-CoA synthetase (NDP forming)